MGLLAPLEPQTAFVHLSVLWLCVPKAKSHGFRQARLVLAWPPILFSRSIDHGQKEKVPREEWAQLKAVFQGGTCPGTNLAQKEASMQTQTTKLSGSQHLVFRAFGGFLSQASPNLLSLH